MYDYYFAPHMYCTADIKISIRYKTSNNRSFVGDGVLLLTTMSALSMILQGTEEAVDDLELVETIGSRPTKLKRSKLPRENNESSSREKLAIMVQDDRQKKWLAGLGHDELSRCSTRRRSARFVSREISRLW